MCIHDDDLSLFEACGKPDLPSPVSQGYAENDRARIRYASYGSGSPIVLLHGGLGNSRNWGYQLQALIGCGYQVILIDSRGHGRSARDRRP